MWGGSKAGRKQSVSKPKPQYFSLNLEDKNIWCSFHHQ